MTFAQLSFSGLIDMGFVMLVAASCIVSLRGAGGGEDGEESASRWRAELKELEQVLKGLIEEASAASTQLDRRLLQRKQELELLLGRLEAGQALIGSESSAQVAAPAAARPAPKAAAASKRPTQEREGRWVLGEDEIGSLAKRPVASSFDDLADAADLLNDRIELSSATPQPAPTAKTAAPRPQATAESAVARPRAAQPAQAAAPREARAFGPSAPATLATQLEAAEALQDEVERETYEQLSIVDPTAYRIARRLLAAGKEIHVVARKLDLPVSEVRLLDRLMRHERKDFVPLEEEEVQVRHIVRETPPVRASAQETPGPAVQQYVLGQPAAGTHATLDSAIERELALL